jgi:hypothetical protein
VGWDDGEEVNMVFVLEITSISCEAAASLLIKPPLRLSASTALTSHFSEKLL